MLEPTPSIDQLVNDIYNRLSAFRSASEQLAESALQTKATSESWKSLTVNFSKTVEDSREGIESVIKSTKAAIDIAQSSQADLKVLSNELREIKMAKRLEVLELDQKEARELLIDLRTRQQDRIRAVEEILDDVRARIRLSARLNAALLILCSLLSSIAIAMLFKNL